LAELLGPNGFSWTILLDLSDVDYLDSSGVGWLMRCHKRFSESGGLFVIHSMSAMARNTIKLLKLDAMLHIAENEQAAIELTEKGAR
jgi:anti-anti-sigma factor